MIVDKALAVSNKKAGIAANIRRYKPRAFPKSVASGKTEPAAEDYEEDETDASGSSSDFDHLLGMAIWSPAKGEGGLNNASLMHASGF